MSPPGRHVGPVLGRYPLARTSNPLEMELCPYGFRPSSRATTARRSFSSSALDGQNLLAKQQRAAYRDTVQTPAITSTDLGDTP